MVRADGDIRRNMFLVEYRALLNRLNPTCTRGLEDAVRLAMKRGHYEIATEHYLLRLLDDPNADVSHVFSALSVSATPLTRALQRGLERRKGGNSGKPVLSPLLVSWVQDAWLLGSVEGGASRVRSGHLLAVLLAQPERYEAGDYADVLRSLDREAVRKKLGELAKGSAEVPTPEPGPAEAAGDTGAAGTPGTAGLTSDSALARFTYDLTERARKGKIDPVIGRVVEIRQMVDILCRRSKNNPIIVGESGVGKTALAEGLALAIAAGEVPAELRGVELRSLDLGLLQAGAGVKGEFEARLTGVISEVKASAKPIILFIDEAHTLIGAGNQAGGSDAANLLKPALSRGELRTIAATTWSEYKKHFEKDAALSRRFQPVRVEEPSEDVAVAMLQGLRPRFIQSHGIPIRGDAVQAAVELSSRYLSGRLLPDKAVDLLDTCAARVKVALGARPGILEETLHRLSDLERRRETRLEDLRLQGKSSEGDEELTKLDAALRSTTAQRDELQERWQKEKQAAEAVLNLRRDGAGDDAIQQALAALSDLRREVPLVPIEVEPETVASVIADWTGIPVGKMVRDDYAAVRGMEDRLRSRIRGQDHATAAIAQRIKNARAGLQDPRQPLGVFLLVGPTGTGKTETALTVADQLFGGERFMVTINMSEFQEKHTDSRLIGSPPGYVGYGEGGALTEAVRQRPYSVVLLDEVEKAHPDIMNLFYQVFDKGMLADGESRNVSFRNTVVFMTSNLGSEVTLQMAARGEINKEALDKELRPLLARHFKPALLERMTVVPYLPITAAVLREIIDLKLGRVAERMQESHEVVLTFDAAVGTAISARCRETERGARIADHIIRESLLPVLAQSVLGYLADAGKVPKSLRVALSQGGEFIVTETVPPPQGSGSEA